MREYLTHKEDLVNGISIFRCDIDGTHDVRRSTAVVLILDRKRVPGFSATDVKSIDVPAWKLSVPGLLEGDHLNQVHLLFLVTVEDDGRVGRKDLMAGPPDTFSFRRLYSVSRGEPTWASSSFAWRLAAPGTTLPFLVPVFKTLMAEILLLLPLRIPRMSRGSTEIRRKIPHLGIREPRPITWVPRRLVRAPAPLLGRVDLVRVRHSSLSTEMVGNSRQPMI